MVVKSTQRFQKSVFARILLIVVVACAADLLFLAIGSRFFFRPGSDHQGNLAQESFECYGRELAARLGSPPDANMAQKLNADTGLEFSYSGPAGSWRFPQFPNHDGAFPDEGPGAPPDGPPPGMDAPGGFLRPPPPPHGFGRGPGRPLRKLKIPVQGGGSIIVREPAHERPPFHPELIFITILIVTVTAVGGFTYLAIKKVISPLRDLSEGVRQLRDGNLSVKIKPQGDEFGDIANLFNEMVGSMRDMLTSKERLFVDLSHELRSPLTRVRLILELMDDGRHRDRLSEEFQEMETLVTSILDTARYSNNLPVVQRTSGDLNDFCQKMVDRYRVHSPEIIFSHALNALNLNTDFLLLTRVVSNILDNALKYSKGSARPVEVSVSEFENHALIKVVDFGPGIPEEDLQQVFEPFYRADKSRTRETGGYGLGLAISKKITHNLGGNLVLTSQPGEGTQAVISLPL